MVLLINVILVTKIIYIIVATAEGKCSTEQQKVKEVSGDIFHSLKSFAANMQRFFYSVAEDINEKRIKFKTILHNVVKDVQSDKNLKNSDISSAATRFTPTVPDKHIKRYLTNDIEVSAREEVSPKESTVKNTTSKPTLEEFLQFIDEYSAYNDDITKTVLPVTELCETSTAPEFQTVKVKIIPPRNNQKLIPKNQNNCKLKSVIYSIIKMLQDKQNDSVIDGVPASTIFKHFESNTVPYDRVVFLKKKPRIKQEQNILFQQQIHNCLDIIFKDLSHFVEVKMNNKLDKLQKKAKNDKRHFADEKNELIQDVINYFNQKYIQNDNSTPEYKEEYATFSPNTEFLSHIKFKPTPKVFKYFIKKFTKSNSYTRIDQSLQEESSSGVISSTTKTTTSNEDLSRYYEEAAVVGNVTNLQSRYDNYAVSKLLKFIKANEASLESTKKIPKSQLLLNDLKSTPPTQNEQSKVTSALKVFLKFINLYSKKNESSVKTTTTTFRPTKPACVVLKKHLVFSHGYKVELHHIETIDGYRITVHRILPCYKVRPISKRRNRIALLHHGLLGSADDWVLLGPNKALPYLLTDIGYDVWLTNARGNKYSQSSSNRGINTTDYWNFSFHEIGLYDLSAVIDHIRVATKGNCGIDFIGHSMGATALLVLLSTAPQYNLLLRSAILLAPLAYMYKSQGLFRLLSQYQTKKGYKALYFLGETEFMPSQAFPKKVRTLYCKGDRTSCMNPWLLIANGGLNMQNRTYEKIILSHVPAGGSTKTIVHYTQLVRSGQFQRFDLGAANNAVRYGTRAPPSYRLNDVTLPVVIFSSQDDLLSTATDIKNLISNLPNFVGHHVVKKDKFTHTDFVWAEDAPVAIYYRIIDLLDQDS